MNFDTLLPEIICDAIAHQGYTPTGALFPPNSYENRVYEIPLEEDAPVIAKFYRPGRWSAETISNAHYFVKALGDLEIPVVAPLPLPHPIAAINTLAQTESIYYDIYPKFRGRARDELSLDDHKWLGRMIARMHNAGAPLKAPHRWTLTPQSFGYDSLQFILSQPFISAELKHSKE